jgi:tRNA threonylcarbamoyladenosine biosynthesis protein TsaE
MSIAAALWTLLTASPDQTFRLGCTLGRHARPGQVIALQGDLGAGKTTLTQGIAAGLGIRARVTSPTFTLVNEYAGQSGPRLVHIDAYRLGDETDRAVAESATFGLEEILDREVLEEMDGGAVAVVEWAERVAPLLPDDCLFISLSAGDDPDQRAVAIRASGPRSQALLAALRAEMQAWNAPGGQE